ncbi:MAG TPA: OmpH family outer membrane protein [Candidatus Alistipes avicola]|uniref:OmpH family outer membrane protein n=1 Tax=Candidatus Alistipes avicola TaxID=2838432 RepID=A0A9D2L5C5_9BACT|nr:OmpH family outer membrane protein [Candidatus Alistipes avicola]
MKKFFFLALVALAGMTACGTKNAEPTTDATSEEQQSVGSSDIAYVVVEGVLSESDIYKNEGIPLQEKTEKTQKKWLQRRQNLEAEAAQLNEKYQKGLITTNNMQIEAKKLEDRMASLQATIQKEGQTLDEENFVFTNRAQDLMRRAIQNINADRRYKIIFDGSALLDADSTLNISPAVLQEVNRLYAEESKDKK